MPIAISKVLPLSKAWTHQTLVSQAMALTNTIDNEIVQTSQVRAHANIAISHIAELLSTANYPFYGIDGIGTFETQDSIDSYATTDPVAGSLTSTGTLINHNSGLLQINLRTFNAANPTAPIPSVASWSNVYFDNITKISALPTIAQDSLIWSGNLTKLDLSQMLELISYRNDGWRNSGAWCWHGDNILVFFGQNIASAIVGSSATANYNTGCGQITIMGFRQPILDDLLPPVNSSTWTTMVDLPDKYMKLALQMTQKMILEQLNQQIPAQLEANIAQTLQQIQGTLQSDFQLEQLKEKK